MDATVYKSGSDAMKVTCIARSGQVLPASALDGVMRIYDAKTV